MAFGLPIVTTRWRSIPELLPSGYPGLVAIRSPAQIADHLLQLLPVKAAKVFEICFYATSLLKTTSRPWQLHSTQLKPVKSLWPGLTR
jgi:hypothetical protein